MSGPSMGTGKRIPAAILTAGVSAVLLLALSFFPGCGSSPPQEPSANAAAEAAAREKEQNRGILQTKEAPVYGYEVVNTYDHDRSAFTQGLVMDEGLLYEGTGLYGESRLTGSELETGEVLREHDLAEEYFGEGITVLGDEVFQLTYKSNLGFIYDKETFELERTFQYPGQGWGLTHDGSRLIMSDGSPVLYFLDPRTMQDAGSLFVQDNEGPLYNLNELEYIDGEIYANVWKTSLIAIISPQTGEVTGWIDLAGLNPDPAELKGEYVLNGIAYDPLAQRLLVTGKCWPHIYEIELIPERAED